MIHCHVLQQCNNKFCHRFFAVDEFQTCTTSFAAKVQHWIPTLLSVNVHDLLREKSYFLFDLAKFAWPWVLGCRPLCSVLNIHSCSGTGTLVNSSAISYLFSLTLLAFTAIVLHVCSKCLCLCVCRYGQPICCSSDCLDYFSYFKITYTERECLQNKKNKNTQCHKHCFQMQTLWSTFFQKVQKCS